MALSLLKTMLAIAELRKARNLTQRQLAERVGTNEGQIASWENGRRGRKIERVVKLCQVLECEAQALSQYGLKAFRIARNLKPKDVASQIRVSERAVFAWESGEMEIEGLTQAIALCRALGCATADLVK